MSRPHKVCDEEILMVARTHFIRGGHRVSVNEIARELGISHSAVLQRFGSKRALMLHALEVKEEFSWPRHFNSGPPNEVDEALSQLREVADMLIAYLAKNMPRIRVLQAAGIHPSEVYLGRLPPPLIACQNVAAWIKRGIEREIFYPCDASSLAAAFVGAMFARPHLQTAILMYTTSQEKQGDPSELEGSLLGSVEGVVEGFARALFLENRPEEKLEHGLHMDGGME